MIARRLLHPRLKQVWIVFTFAFVGLLLWNLNVSPEQAKGQEPAQVRPTQEVRVGTLPSRRPASNDDRLEEAGVDVLPGPVTYPAFDPLDWPASLLPGLGANVVGGAQALVWQADAGGLKVESLWEATGNYYGSIGDCETAYNVATNTLSGVCDIGTGVDLETQYFRWTGVPSAGYHSDKPSQTRFTGASPVFLSDVAAVAGGQLEGRVVGEARQTDSHQSDVATCRSIDVVTDAATALPLAIQCSDAAINESLRLLTTKLDIASGPDVADKVRGVESRVASAKLVEEVNWGFQRASRQSAQQRFGYEVPGLDGLAGFDLSETYMASEAHLAESFNPAATDYVVQVYRRGLGEVVVTTRRAEAGSDWLNDPLAIDGSFVPLQADGYSQVVTAPDVPVHFWGSQGDVAITVEGYNVSSDVLNDARAQLVGGVESYSDSSTSTSIDLSGLEFDPA